MDKRKLIKVLGWAAQGGFEVADQYKSRKNQTITEAIDAYERIYGVNRKEAITAVGENFRRGEEEYQKYLAGQQRR
jgi:hypothetical protein